MRSSQSVHLWGVEHDDGRRQHAGPPARQRATGCRGAHDHRPDGHRHAPGRARRPLRPQRRQPVHGDQPPPLLRRRHGPRRAPARRPGRVVPQPVRADAVPRRPLPRHPQPRGRTRHARVEGQHPCGRPRREDPRPRGGPLPLRARRRSRHGRPDRLRRRAEAARSPPTPRSAPSPASCWRSATRRSSRTCATCGSRPTACSSRPRTSPWAGRR